MAKHEAMSDFMFSRGLIGVAMSMTVYRIVTGKFSFPLLAHTKKRMTYGSVGMALQVFGASHIPISMYALINRATPVWFSMLMCKRVDLFSGAIILILAASPFAVQSLSHGLINGLIVGIGTMLVATFLIAFSQKSQAQGAGLESRWLMPFAPAFGLVFIGAALSLVATSDALPHISVMGLVSGGVMTLAYWSVQPLLLLKNGGARMVLIDLVASLALGLGEVFEQQSLYSLVYVGLTALVFAVLSWKSRVSVPCQV